MSETAFRKCPKCGQKTSDLLLAQCPYCRVALVSEGAPQMTALTPEQIGAVARHILGSWKFWAGVAIVVGLAAWGVVQIDERLLDFRSNEYLNTLEQKATNHIGTAFGQISNQVSNQIIREFQQPRIRTTMEQIAADKANDLITNAVWPSLEALRQSLDEANAQLTRSSNDLATLAKNIKVAQRKASQTSPTPPNASDSAAKLSLVDQNVARNGSNYVLSLFFKPVGSQPVGAVELIAGTYQQTAKILNFAAVTPGQTEPAVMNDLGDASRLKFVPRGGDSTIVVALELTAPTIVRVTGDVLDGDLTIPVAAEKLSGPTASK